MGLFTGNHIRDVPDTQQWTVHGVLCLNSLSFKTAIVTIFLSTDFDDGHSAISFVTS